MDRIDSKCRRADTEWKSICMICIEASDRPEKVSVNCGPCLGAGTGFILVRSEMK